LQPTFCTLQYVGKRASQLITRSARHSPKSYDELTGGETPCCDELTGASNVVLSLLWRVNRMLLSA